MGEKKKKKKNPYDYLQELFRQINMTTAEEFAILRREEFWLVSCVN